MQPEQEFAFSTLPWKAALDEYRRWIESKDPAEYTLWERRLQGADQVHVEASVAEAVAWDYLRNRVDDIRPFDPKNVEGKRPDFECMTAGLSFVVEVSNISIQSATQASGLPPRFPHPPKTLRPSQSRWLGKLKSRVTEKTKQGGGLEMPYIVFVSTLHLPVTLVLCSKDETPDLIHSTPKIEGFIDESGNSRGEPQVVVDFQHSSFTKSHSLAAARENVSAVLVGGFGTYPNLRVHGAHRPNATRPLAESSIRHTPMCRADSWPPGDVIHLSWCE